MAVYELYSKRRKRERGETPDVFSYDNIPIEIRRQVVHIWHDVIGNPSLLKPPFAGDSRDVYHAIAQALRREYGLFRLSVKAADPSSRAYSMDDLTVWFLAEQDTERVLDAIELSFKVVNKRCARTGYIGRRDAIAITADAIKELNARFKEHGLGYEFSNDMIIRIDSQLIHAEAVLPALDVLRGSEFANAHQEFLSAFEHYRHRNGQEALVEACKCFESTMKVICDKRGWSYDQRGTVSDLVRIFFDRGLIPPYWQTHFSGLRSILESSIATPRNRQGGHGAGSGPSQDPPDDLVSYVLHITAATVLFLSEAEKRIS